MKLLHTCFPTLTQQQIELLGTLPELYREWNAKINVVSRKDIDNFEERHLIHSLTIGLYFNFVPGTTILDVGTGGGLPGIPLAIMFPEVEFTLADSVIKKIGVVNSIVETLGLNNVKTEIVRVEKMGRSFDFVVSRAVAGLAEFVRLSGNRVTPAGFNNFANGILYLKGGDFDNELNSLKGWKHKVFEIYEKIPLPFFETKKLIYLYRRA